MGELEAQNSVVENREARIRSWKADLDSREKALQTRECGVEFRLRQKVESIIATYVLQPLREALPDTRRRIAALI
jgi:hypothetical protein